MPSALRFWACTSGKALAPVLQLLHVPDCPPPFKVHSGHSASTSALEFPFQRSWKPLIEALLLCLKKIPTNLVCVRSSASKVDTDSSKLIIIDEWINICSVTVHNYMRMR